MRRPKWLDRERRILDLKTLARVKVEAAEMWFRRYQTLSRDLYIARSERDTAREEVERLREQITEYEQGAIPS